MKIEAIKNLNITALFSVPLNHLLISQKDLLDLFKTGDQQKDGHTFVEAPGLKVLIFPNRRKEFIFEGTRVLVNDKEELPLEKSIVIENFQKIMNSGMVELNKIVAYGFNFDAIVLPENDKFKIDDLVGSKISTIPNIKNAGVNILFEGGEAIHTLEIKPVGNEQKFLAHFNAHINTNKLPETKKLQEEIIKQFREFKKIIQQI